MVEDGILDGDSLAMIEGFQKDFESIMKTKFVEDDGNQGVLGTLLQKV